MSFAPGQVVRYALNDADALWPRVDCRPTAIPPCPLCGAPRIFEMQLMPQLISAFGFDAASPSCPDFGTAAVYTCSASCALPSGRSYAEEFVHVQPPP